MAMDTTDRRAGKPRVGFLAAGALVSLNPSSCLPRPLTLVAIAMGAVVLPLCPCFDFGQRRPRLTDCDRARQQVLDLARIQSGQLVEECSKGVLCYCCLACCSHTFPARSQRSNIGRFRQNEGDQHSLTTWLIEKGWAFFRHSEPDTVLTGLDGEIDEYGDMANSNGATIEVHCRRCGSHMGHILFVLVALEQLHCINGTSLIFHPETA